MPLLKKPVGSNMPKEQPCFSEHSPCASSSKNAKDKSNNTTLLATHNTKDTKDSKGRGKGSCCSSEKDSGYSDGSDWQQTDVEDQQSNKSQSRGGQQADNSQPGQNQELGQGNAGKPSLMPVGCELPPIYIIKNVVLQQPEMIQKSGQLLHRDGRRETSSSGAAHVILLQQPSLLPVSLKLRKPVSQKSSTTGRKLNGTSLPILNSYPRIAPHPSKKPPDKSSLNNESQNVSKRVCTDRKSDDTPESRSLPEQHLYKKPTVPVLSSGLPCSSSTSLSSSSATTVSSSQSSPSGSILHTTSSFLATRGLHKNSTTSTRHRRFLNTAEILRQSGLLGITLRTKELLRQSNATDQDIAQLRQHTELLCQAASNPGCSLELQTRALEYLHQTMAESGSYPHLKIPKNEKILYHPDSSSQPEVISTNCQLAAEKADVPSHRLTATLNPQQSHSGQGREISGCYKSSDKVTFMNPDSSTG